MKDIRSSKIRKTSEWRIQKKNKELEELFRNLTYLIQSRAEDYNGLGMSYARIHYYT